MRGIRKIAILSNFLSKACNDVVGGPGGRAIVSTLTKGKGTWETKRKKKKKSKPSNYVNFELSKSFSVQ